MMNNYEMDSHGSVARAKSYARDKFPKGVVAIAANSEGRFFTFSFAYTTTNKISEVEHALRWIGLRPIQYRDTGGAWYYFETRSG